MIIVSLTSWIKRIQNVKSVVESIMKNTIQPDRVYLNLSRTEFEGIDLPEDLVDYFNSDERLIINWVDGENTKSMKKVFPILGYLNDDDIIITADDDIIFPNDLIESRINDFKTYGEKYSITSNKSLMGLFPNMYVASAISLYTKRMLNNWEKYVDDEIIKTYNDDRTYLYILWFNGFLNKPCTKYDVKLLLNNYDLNLIESSMKLNRVNIVAGNYDKIANKRILKFCNSNTKDMFGYFNNIKTIKTYDCVMPYGRVGINSIALTCGEHLEIEYVIASLRKYCSTWLGRIFIVGTEPPEQIKDYVIHIPCDNPYTHCKDANIIHKIRYACENIPDLSDDFLMISDDQIVTKESSWEDMKPRIVRKYSDWREEKWEKNRKIDFWHESLYQTLNLFSKETSAFWEPHIWSPINKHKFIDMCKSYDYKNNISCIILSLYYNFIQQDIIRGYEHTHLENNKALRIIPSLNLNNIERHLSWSDTAFSQKMFRDLLDEIVGFKPRKNFNNSNKIESIKKLREDIQSGRIIKVPTQNGFVWKRVK